MKVFISWSGAPSRGVAEALQWWFPMVLQGVKPFVSAKDIDKGSNWTFELARELTETEFGVVCLTPDNLSSPWLHYETGAITRSVESRVCPLLHRVEKSDVAPPLGQLQLTDLSDRDDVLLMMGSMNAAAGNNLSAEDLRQTVEMWWPRLTARLDSVPLASVSVAKPKTAEPEQPGSSDRELLLEVLTAVRHLSSRVAPAPQVRVLSPQQEADRESRRGLMKDLQAAGLSSVGGRADESGWTLIVNSLPQPVPDEVASLLSKAAKGNEVTISLRESKSNGRTVEWNSNGSLNEPF